MLPLIQQSSELNQLIMVKKPYNVLFDVCFTSNEHISAKVQNEYLEGNELGPILCSEAGRHLAILGSLLLSQKSSVESYYLATSAKIKRKSLSTNTTEIFNVEATVISSDKRKGKIKGIVLGSGTTFFEAIIEYQILKVPIFQKLFKEHFYKGKVFNEISPYRKRRKLTDIVLNENEITGVYGTILPNECEGHFENYPVLPVAIIGNLLGEIGIELFLAKNTNFSNVIVLSADIKAKKLIFHGAYLTFRGVLKNTKVGVTRIFCEAIVHNKVVANADFEVVGVEE